MSIAKAFLSPSRARGCLLTKTMPLPDTLYQEGVNAMVRLKGLEPTHISVREPKSRMSTNSITGAKEKPCCRSSRVWSGQRGSNSLPPPWQGGALPDELCPRQCLLFYHKKRSCQVFSCTAAKGRQSRAYSETSSEILAQTGKMKYTHTICQKGEKKWNFKRF